MIPDETPAVVEEDAPVGEDEPGYADVYGDTPPTDEYRLSTR